MSKMNDKEILKELREITKNKKSWKANIDDVASKLDNTYSDTTKAKALWLLGEMGLKYPEEIEKYVEDIAGHMYCDNPKLRERSLNAIGRIDRADKNLITPYLDKLMTMKDDESENVRHAFI